LTFFDFDYAIGTTIRCGRARLHLREAGPKTTRTNENHHAGNRPVMANLQGLGAEVTQEGSTADMEDVRKANLEVTEVGEKTEEHSENELEEGERTQEKNQGAQEYQEEEATPPRREGEWSVADHVHINRFLQQELKEFEVMSGVSHIAQHTITMRDDRPVKQRFYPKNPAMQRVIDDQVNELLAAGQIEPSKSPYSTPIVLVRKKNDECRMCVDFRQLNARSIPDAYPTPRFNYILERLRQARVLST